MARLADLDARARCAVRRLPVAAFLESRLSLVRDASWDRVRGSDHVRTARCKPTRVRNKSLPQVRKKLSFHWKTIKPQAMETLLNKGRIAGSDCETLKCVGEASTLASHELPYVRTAR